MVWAEHCSQSAQSLRRQWGKKTRERARTHSLSDKHDTEQLNKRKYGLQDDQESCIPRTSLRACHSHKGSGQTEPWSSSIRCQDSCYLLSTPGLTAVTRQPLCCPTFICEHMEILVPYTTYYKKNQGYGVSYTLSSISTKFIIQVIKGIGGGPKWSNWFKALFEIKIVSASILSMQRNCMIQGGTVLKPLFPKLSTCSSQCRRHHYQPQEGNTRIRSNVFKLRAIACA